MALFADRAAAGRELAASLNRWRGADAVVLGIPRGGVVVAAAVAEALRLPLGVAVVRKLGAPHREEYAVGAIADGVRVVDERAARAVGATDADIERIERRERAELSRRARVYDVAAPAMPVATAIVVDDGIATGATATAACRSVKAQGAASVVLAAPVAPVAWAPPAEADEFVCPHRMRDFWAVGQYFDRFTQTTDAEVIALLESADLRGR